MVVGTENLHVGEHVVQFYGRDEELARRVADYLRGPSRQGSIGGVSPRYGVPGSLRTFAYSLEAPADARHFAIGELRRWDAGDLTDDVALVVTELAANAIVHARSGFTLAMSARQDTLRISVRDTTPLPAESGALLPAPLHGLGAVDALAIRWGVVSLGSAGKEVWVELRR